MRLPEIIRAFLVVMLLGGGVFGAEAGGESRTLSDCFPADTFVYFEIPDVPAVIEGSKGTGLYALWYDDSMQAIREYVEGLGAPAGEAEDGGLKVLRLVRAFGESISGGVAVGMSGDPDGFEYLIVIEVGEDTSAAEALLEDIFAEAGDEIEAAVISGVDARTWDGGKHCTVIVDGVLFAGSKYAFTGALDRRNSATSAGSLSASAHFQKSVSLLTEEEPAYRGMVDLPKLLDMARKAVAGKVPIDIDRLLRAIDIDSVETVSMEGFFRLSGVVDRICVSTKSADSKLLDLVGREAFDESWLAVVPRGAVFFSGGQVDFDTGYETILEMMDVVGGAVGLDFRGMVEEFERATGVSVEGEVLPALGSRMIRYMSLPEGPLLEAMMMGGGFEQATLIEAVDEEALEGAIKKLADYAEADPTVLARMLGPAMSAGKLERTTLGKLKIYSVTSPGMAMMSPSVAVTNGYVVYANSKDAVVSAVDRLIAPVGSAVDSPDYMRARGAVGEGPSQISFFDLDRVVDVVYDNVLPMLVRKIDEAHQAGTIPFTSADVPGAFRVKRHLDGVAMTTSTSGNVIDVEIYSPSGIAPLPASVLTARFLIGSRAAVEAEAPAAATLEAMTPEQEKLSRMGAALQLATMESHGQFPEKLSDVFAAEELQAPQDPEPDSPVDYEYVSGLSTSSPGKTILVYERRGLQEEGRHVLYVDGSVGFLSEEETPE